MRITPPHCKCWYGGQQKALLQDPHSLHPPPAQGCTPPTGSQHLLCMDSKDSLARSMDPFMA